MANVVWYLEAPSDTRGFGFSENSRPSLYSFWDSYLLYGRERAVIAEIVPDNPVFLKLQWAEKRLRELDGMLAACCSQPQPIVMELDANENFLLYRLKHDPVIRPDIPLMREIFSEASGVPRRIA